MAACGSFLRKRDDPLGRLRNEDRLRSKGLRWARQGLPRPNQHAAGSIKDRPLQHLRALETNLTLCGMNIAINEFAVHFDVKHANGMLAALNDSQICLPKGLLDSGTVNWTPVEE